MNLEEQLEYLEAHTLEEILYKFPSFNIGSTHFEEEDKRYIAFTLNNVEDTITEEDTFDKVGYGSTIYKAIENLMIEIDECTIRL